MNVAVATRIGLPIAAQPRTVKLIARKRTRVVVAGFRDAGGASGSGLRASILRGDATSWNGVVLCAAAASTTSAARSDRHVLVATASQ
jgi:hypothetical protein